MVYCYACLTLQRMVLPIILVLAALYRPVGISFVYLLMFLILPFIPVAKKRNFKGSVTPYFIILIALSTILLLCHIGLQISIFALEIGDSFGTCTVIERLLRHVGFIGFKNLSVFAIIEWLVPEVLVFITSVSVYVAIKKMTQKVEVSVESGNVDPTFVEQTIVVGDNAAAAELSSVKVDNDVTIEKHRPHFDGLILISPLFCLATLFFAAVLRPSVPGGFYFLIFLLSGSYWATFRSLHKKFAILLCLVMVVVVAHIISILAYQTPWMQDYLDKTSLTARLIGLEPLVTSTCANDIRIIYYDSKYKTDSFLNPIVLFLTYYILALSSKNLIRGRIIAKPATASGNDVQNNSSHKIQRQISLITQTSRSSKKDISRSKSQCLNVTIRRDQQHPQIITEPNETTPLMRSTTRKQNIQTSDINSGITPEQQQQEQQQQQQQEQPSNNDIVLSPLERHHSVHIEYKTGICDQIWYGISGIGGFIYQNCYVFTNVLMMAWSIVYHSWLTFVLLLWANVLWMIPNQREAMMRSTPFIVLYGELLLIAQYVYGMDLNNDELPTTADISGMNLKQIGFERPQENGVQPCIPLIVKTLFVLMFWITLRQFFKEKADRKRDGTMPDLFTSLQLSRKVSGKRTSKFLKKAGIIIKNLLVRLWIWLLVLVIFLCAMTGEKMTGFRICYMALFLFFLLVFQSSSKAWLKLMYGFWLFLIFYAMSILTLVYTYQFDKFDQYWEKYLNVSTTLQTDIGLERYKTKDLFLHLVSPTIIIILTVIQVHYFHKRFLLSLNKPSDVAIQEPVSQMRFKRRTSARLTEFENMAFAESAGYLIRVFLRRFLQKSKQFLKNLKAITWRLLELHWIKVVYITAFSCATSEVSLLNIPFVTLCVVGVVSNVRMQFFFSRVISLVVTLIVLSKMIYQITYLTHANYYYKCSQTSSSALRNNAEWFGLQKSSPEVGLMSLIKHYIIYMVIATLHAVICLRQNQVRVLKGTQDDPPPKVLFPDVGREDAEIKLEFMIKYLFNYGFYKFGYEICLIALVSTITYRQDIIAVAYSVWLVFLLMFSRKKNARIWGVLQVFILSSIIVQYIFLVQFPPSMCVEFIWSRTKYSEALQRWSMLPGHLQYDHTKKLIFDFVSLILINRQKRVFTLENIPNYPGGSNKSLRKIIANLGKIEFENPTPDFLSHVRNYLDIFKHAFLCGFYWVTLAVAFLAGTNISDLMAIGYLVGAFVFLWEGSDFYLRPIRSIRRRWRYLLAYNVGNIVLKTSLQMAGCLFMDALQKNCCWLVHLLGISCTSRGVSNISEATYDCPASSVHSVLLWDAICFAFLIFQLRIFNSYYFCHIITDTIANNIFASRGAEIIEGLRQKQIQKRQEHDEEVLRKIKQKMEIIRSTQQKMIRPLQKVTHFDEQGNPVYGLRPQKRKEIKLHPHAVRAGDYYMFDDVDEKFKLEVITDEGLLDDNENITESEIKMNRRKTMYDEGLRSKSFKDTQSDTGPSTSKKAHFGEKTEHKYEVDSELEEDSDADLQANPIIRLLEGYLVSLTIRLNRLSRNYRYVNKILAKEKKALKESNNIYTLRGRNATKSAASLFSTLKRHTSSDESEDAAAPSTSSKRKSNNALNNIINIPETPQTNQNIYVSPKSPSPPPQPPLSTLQPSLPTTATTSTIQSSDIQQYNDEATDTLDAADARKKFGESSKKNARGRKSESLPEIRVKAPSFDRGHRGSTSVINKQRSQYKINSSEITLDEGGFTARDHNIIIEVLISSWFAILSNTDLICYIVVFINQVVNASLISLPLPLMVFLWGTLSLPRPTKTFWITLIAYTQAVVLIKCIFQYKLIWANYHYNLPNNPLGVEKLFGIQMTPNYATYDLLLLLVLVFHRFILKSHGLWKVDMHKAHMDDYDSLSDLMGDETSSSSSDSFTIDSQDSYIKIRTYSKKKKLSDATQVSFLENKKSISSQGANDKNVRNESDHDDDTKSEHRKSGGAVVVQEERTTLPSTDLVENMQRNKYLSGLTQFYKDLIYKTRLPSDVYSLMFLCDFINFFVLLFGFTAFSSEQTDGGVKTYIAENKVPTLFLITLLIQFFIIVIDRALYLRKSMLCKICFHFIFVLAIHVWMFFVVPAVTERSFYASAPPIIFYMFKCFYFLLSSYQIKCGYPNRILGNCLTNSFSMLNMLAFKIYMLMPFFYELRTILDWLCIDTTMTLFDWLKMEDIFAHIFAIKCLRQMETDFPAIRAQKKATYLKLLMGGSAILLIVFALWGPLTLFALSGTVGQPNIPTEVKVSVQIGSYDPIYESITRESTYAFNEAMFSRMKNAYIKNKEALSFLLKYDASDVAAIKMKKYSPSMWKISPPDKAALLEALKGNSTLTVRFTFALTRTPPVKSRVGVFASEITWEMTNKYSERATLVEMIETGNAKGSSITIPYIVPTFVKVLNSGNPTYIPALMPTFNNTQFSDFSSMSVSINSTENSDLWWEITEYCQENNALTNLLKKLPFYDCSTGIIFYTFNDKKFPSTWTFLTGGGIIGLYTTFVLLASRFLKNFLGGQTRRIMYEDLPNVDRVLQLCLDIYLVREALEFVLEEDLFAKLIFLYRSPETMIKWTRPREDGDEESS